MHLSNLFFYSFALIIAFASNSQGQSVSQPVKVLDQDKKTYVIRRSSIDIIQGKSILKPVIHPDASVNDAAIRKQELWLATDRGIYVYDLNNYQLLYQYFNQQKITAVATDINNEIWVGTFLNGVYKHSSKDSFEQKLNVTAVYTLLCTPDSNTYIGTNIGLYKMNIFSGQTTRFAEEGHSGYELPDNIVEQLFKDDYSNIWVIMPDNISFKSSKSFNGEIPSYAFVGDKSNKIINIMGIRNKAFLIATQKSIALLPAGSIEHDHHHAHSDEIFSRQNTHAFSINMDKLKAPESLKSEPVTYVGKVKENIYFFTDKGYWKTSEKNVLKQLGL